MIYGRVLFTSEMIAATRDNRPTAHERYLQVRRARYKRRLENMGVRRASINRYLSRGFPRRDGPFMRAWRSELNGMIRDLWTPRSRHLKKRRAEWRELKFAQQACGW